MAALKTGEGMKFSRNIITLLALASASASFAGDNRWFAGKYRPAPAASVTAAPEGGNRWFAGKYRPVAMSYAPVNDDKACKDKNHTAMSCPMACYQGQHSDPKKA
jgi:hypothetical protein